MLVKYFKSIQSRSSHNLIILSIVCLLAIVSLINIGGSLIEVVSSNSSTAYVIDTSKFSEPPIVNQLASNIQTPTTSKIEKSEDSFYLLSEASRFIPNTQIAEFQERVKYYSNKLKVAPEWLMAVMWSESRFEHKVSNKQGSGAIGLIQFMPGTLKEMGITKEQLIALSPSEQLFYVYKYLNTVRNRYGQFENITQLYLAVLYPKATKAELCYSLYSKPTRAYLQNKGLDEDKDGKVTVYDIDRRMLRMFPSAYIETFSSN